MPNAALIPHRSTRIAPLTAVVDGFPEVRHSLRVETGEAPLEDGAVVQDHAVARSERLTLTGWVSDLKAGTDEQASTGRARNAWNILRQLHRDVTPFEVVTPFGVYREMLITEVEAEELGAGMRFTLKLGEIIRVGAERGAITENAIGPAAGRQSTTERGRIVAQDITATENQVLEVDNTVAETTEALAAIEATEPTGTSDLTEQAAFESAVAAAEEAEAKASSGGLLARLDSTLQSVARPGAPAVRSLLGRADQLAGYGSALGQIAGRVANLPFGRGIADRLRHLARRTDGTAGRVRGAAARADRATAGGLSGG